MLKTSVQRNKLKIDESGLSTASSTKQTMAITFELESKTMPMLMSKKRLDKNSHYCSIHGNNSENF